MFENISQTLGNLAGSHPLVTIVVSLLAGVLVGKVVFGKKKDKKN